jgi:hypothetical protein
MKAFKCDRCKAFYEITYVIQSVKLNIDDREWEICKSCVAEFNDWIAAGPATRKLKEAAN